MVTYDEMVNNTFHGRVAKHCADEYHLALAKITAVYGPRGHKARTDFMAVVDLDYSPVPHPKDACVMMIRCRTEKGKRFKVLPVEFCDFAVVPPFQSPYLDSFEDRAYDIGGFESTADDDVEKIIKSRIYGKQDETPEEIELFCREEAEARDLWMECWIEADAREAEEYWARQEYESSMEAWADVMREEMYENN